MANPIEITVRTQLSKIIKELDGISKSFEDAERGMKKTATNVDDGITTTMRNTQTKIEQSGSLMKRVFAGLKDDVKALLGVSALAGGLKLSNTMRGTISDTIQLSDTVRKLSGVFKIAERDQAGFIGSMTKGLGQIGLGSDAAARALEGLAETQVRGQKNLQSYAKTAGMLAGAGNQKGQEAAIATGLAGVVQAQGKNVNNTEAMKATAEAVNRTHQATGIPITEILANMKELFSTMNSDIKKSMTPQAMSSLIAAGHAGGSATTDFMKSYLSMNKIQRATQDAILGVKGGLFNEKTGVNREALMGLMTRAKGYGMGNVETGLEAIGMSADQAKGLKLLADNIDQVEAAAKNATSTNKNLRESFEDTKTMGESFKGNIDRVKSTLAWPIALATGGMTNLLKSTQTSTIGSAMVVGGSALGSAALIKYGLGGVGAAMGMKNLQERIIEGTGEKIQNVHVTNFSEVKGLGGAGGGAGAAAAGAAETLGVGGAALAGAAVAVPAAIMAGALATVPDYVNKQTGEHTTAIDALLIGMRKIFIEGQTQRDRPTLKVYATAVGPEFRKSPPSSKGANNSGVKH